MPSSLPITTNIPWTASSVSSCTGPDNTIVSVTLAENSSALQITAGQLSYSNAAWTYTPGNTINGYDQGEAPYCSIDPNGLLLEVHESNGIGNTIYANVGVVTPGSIEMVTIGISTSMAGSTPVATSMGPGQFLVAAAVPLVNVKDVDLVNQIGVWLVTVTGSAASGFQVAVQPVNIPWPGEPYPVTTTPSVCYFAGTVAVMGFSSGRGMFGTLNGASIQWQGGFQMDTSQMSSSDQQFSVLLGPNNSIYVAQSDASPEWNWIGVSGGTIVNNSGAYTINWNAFINPDQPNQSLPQNQNIYSQNSDCPGYELSLAGFQGVGGYNAVMATANHDGGPYNLALVAF